jgi:AcrR family transcriptional regulator
MLRSMATAGLGDLFSKSAKGKGKAERTRAKLMDAAVTLFARDGFEAASVNEITKVAEVANGTFYVHFRDRDAIAETVALAAAERVARQMADATADVENAVERIALSTRSFVELAAQRPDWGRMLFRAAWSFSKLREGVLNHVRADIERGIAQGLFNVQADPMLIDVFVAMTLSALNARLQGAGPEAGCRAAELQLRMLGAPARTAKAAAFRPIPPLTLAVRFS